ncbi:hypothetical protein PHYSODRAFT_558163 [Phytophthora sojae]|uniref:Uncharacterized protein n=1 Tax=Phytophthora sojae (strain P6497) TaxID=1094619 RepID=G4Z4B8_PHYSP|nr:hypothetical protein PHYSODRAFT_558163 [Phytophthora sojae]EGZ19424.1 hypothetical protein PHYSODRAFT_558163 [Phytophthora sojae]|eukprot:XP_009522141.1 hypothetical protein PHYSODRAFT_558163 [Phytophthora sojae]
MSVARACELSRVGSLELLDLVWTRSRRGFKSTIASLLNSNQEYYRWEFSQALVQAVRRADLAMIHWLLAHFSRCPVSGEVVREAAKGGHLWTLQLLEADRSHGGIEWCEKSLPEAARVDRWDIVKWLQAHLTIDLNWSDNYELLDIAGRSTKRLCVRERYPRCTSAAMDIAAANGHLDVVKWLHAYRSEGCTAAAMDKAAGGHLKVVQWLHSHRSEGCTAEAMNLAAANGHLGVVKWLLEHRDEWSSAVMDTAAANGHLEVVMWLHANRSEGCTTKAMDEATANGHLDVVRWLHSNRYEEGCTINAMTGAATAGNIEVLDWLYDKAIAVCTQETMDVAACQGHLNVLEWLRNRYTVRCTPDALNTAAINGHLKVVRWLLANRYEGCAARAIRLAASGRDLSVVQCLAPHCSQAELMRAMHNAIASGRFETMVYLHAQRNDEASDEEKRELRNDEEIQEIWRDADRFSYLGLSYPREIRAWLEANYQIAT